MYWCDQNGRSTIEINRSTDERSIFLKEMIQPKLLLLMTLCVVSIVSSDVEGEATGSYQIESIMVISNFTNQSLSPSGNIKRSSRAWAGQADLDSWTNVSFKRSAGVGSGRLGYQFSAIAKFRCPVNWCPQQLPWYGSHLQIPKPSGRRGRYMQPDDINDQSAVRIDGMLCCFEFVVAASISGPA